MPNTPRVEFNFQNNNVQQSVPLLGVSHVMAVLLRVLLINQMRFFQPIPNSKGCMGKK